VKRRSLAYIGIATVLLVTGGLLSLRTRGPAHPPGPEGETAGAPVREVTSPASPLAPRLRSPPSAVAELGVLTDRAESALAEVVDREALAGSVVSRHCGDEEACAAVRAALRDEHTTRLTVAARADWDPYRVDMDAAAAGLPPPARGTLAGRTRMVTIRVATATSARHLAVRAAFAAAAAIAEKIDGLVFDPLLGRVETARDFAAHAVTEPAGASSFRRDRAQLLYQPRSDGVVRILTAGLSRWGAPDVEASSVPTAASARVAEIILAVAEVVANGAASGPVVVSRKDVERVRGAPYPGDAGLPEEQGVSIDLAPVHPEPGDPNDFLARIVPPAGEGPMGYLDLAERFFGAGLAASPGEDVVRSRSARAQRGLPDALARWKASRATGRKLLALLPFAIPGDAGVESMWIEVTDCGDRSITGRLLDDPLAATDVAQGDTVTRARSEVQDVEERAGE
jgi:hypothetical protein